MEDITAANSPDTVRLSLNFMSTHPKAYKHLESSPENISKIEEIEKSLSGQLFHYIPKNKLPDEGFGWIKDGDIIAITTNIPGLERQMSDERKTDVGRKRNCYRTITS